MSQHEDDYIPSDSFEGEGGGGDYSYLQEPGYHRVRINEFRTKKKDGSPYEMGSNPPKKVWKFICTVEFGPFEGQSIMENLFIEKGGFRVRQIFNALDLEVEHDENGYRPPLDEAAGREIVLHMEFQDGQYLHIADHDKDCEFDPILDVDEALRLLEQGDISEDEFHNPVPEDEESHPPF